MKLRGVKVLVVDNEDTVSIAVSRLLRRAGATVTHARNGREALSQVQSSRPDAVVMDVNMPVMGGLEAAVEIRKVVAVCTMLMSSEDRSMEAAQLGFPFLSKAHLGEVALALALALDVWRKRP